MRQKKGFTLLLAVVLALLVLLLLVRHQKNVAAEQAELAAAETIAPAVTSAEDASGDFASITRKSGSTTLSFTRNEDGDWIWADDPSVPITSERLEQFQDVLLNLTPQQTITDGDTQKAYGFESPTCVYTVTDSTGKETVYTLGKTTTDGTSRYLQIDGDQTTTYIVSDTLYAALDVPIYEMVVLPALPHADQNALVSITVEGKTDTSILPLKANDGNIIWNCSGTDRTGEADLATFLNEVTELSLSGCANYKPTEKAATLCGFDNPTMTLTVVWENEYGTEQTFILTVGGVTLDQTNRYARLNDDPAIYTVDNLTIDEILVIAENGFAE